VAGSDDLRFLSGLACDPQVEPFLAPGAGAPERLEAVMTQAGRDGGPSGLFVIESAASRPLGGVALQVISRHSRICELTRLMVDPAVRGSGVGARAVVLACRRAFVEHRFHRVQAETYGDNLAGQRLFERVGFVREGVLRRAYWRRDRWIDGVMLGILAEELRDPPLVTEGWVD
jgi:RimJ/RimL family protein N-acetyltransferase